MSVNNFWLEGEKKKTIDDVFDFNVMEKIALGVLILGALFSILSIMKYQAIETEKDKIFQGLFTYRQYKAYETATKYVKANHDQYEIDSLEPEHAFLAIEKLNDYVKKEGFVIRGLTFSPVELGGKDKFSKLNVTMTLDGSYMKFLKILEDFKDFKIIEKFLFRGGTVPNGEYPAWWKLDFSLSFYYKGKLSEEMLKKMEEMKVVPVLATPQVLPQQNAAMPQTNTTTPTTTQTWPKLPNIASIKRPNN